MRIRAAGIALASLLVLSAAACRDPGPAEQAGREIDEAAEDARDSLDRFGREIEEALEDAKEELD
ncbi:MAG: hypothetical protein JJT85_08735 [Chromatiales bacterium]|nr:hypothetical protein [Chromatiales bacterium]